MGVRGTSFENPAVSGIEVRDSGGGTGWYWIQTSNMAEPKPVYVNNTDQGGGWMLVSYASNFENQGMRPPQEFTLATPPASFTGQLFACNRFQLWYHYGEAQCDSTMRMGTTTINATPILAECSIARKVIYDNPEAVAPMSHPTSFEDATLTGLWQPVKGYSQVPSAAITASSNWATSFDVWWSDCTPSNLGVNPYMSWTNFPSQGSNFYGLADVPANSYAISQLNTVAQYIR